MPSYKGHCHCGEVSFEFTTEQPIDGGTRCTCSICVRKGAMMSNEFIDEANLKVNQPKENLGVYQFGNKKAKHYFCKTCGIYPFHATARFPDKYRVNLGCIDEVDPLELPVTVFDGKNLL